MAPLIEPLRVDVVAGRQLRVHPVDAVGRADESLAVGLLADLDEDLADGVLDPAVVAAVVDTRRSPR